MGGVVPALLTGLLQIVPTSALALTEEMCIADDPDAQVVFGRFFNDVAVGQVGSVFVRGDLAPQAFRFSREGTLLHAFGRRGSGPGEFQRPAEIALSGDGLWVHDIQLRRASLFDVEGEFMRVSAGSDLLGRFGPGFVAGEPWRMDASLAPPPCTWGGWGPRR